MLHTYHSVHGVEVSWAMSYASYMHLPSHKQLLGLHAGMLHAAEVGSLKYHFDPSQAFSLGWHLALGSDDKLWAALRSFGQSWSSMGTYGRRLYGSHACIPRDGPCIEFVRFLAIYTCVRGV